MLQKSHTKPETSVFSEVKKEISPYMASMENKGKTFLHNNPKPIFAGMVIIIVLSCILSFWVLPSQKAASTMIMEESFENLSGSYSNDFSNLMENGKKAQMIYDLEVEIDHILEKGSMSKQDSISLEKAITELETFNKK